MGLAGTPGDERRASEKRRLTPLRQLAGAIVALLAVGGLMLFATAMSASFSPSGTAAAATTCDPSQPAHVSYRVATAPAASPTETLVISAVVVSGLGSGCDGLPAELLLGGNSAGDPAEPAVLLSTATSTRDPCTQSKLSSPQTVDTGSIVLGLCATPGTKGSAVSVHDLTHLTLFIGGTQIEVTPVTAGGSGSGSGAGPSGPRSVHSTTVAGGGLAFTGVDIAATTIGGLLVVLLGLSLLLIGRQRRSQTTGDPAP